MKYCPNCGTQCEDDAAFCTSCGTPLEQGKNNTYGSQQNNYGSQQNNYGSQQNNYSGQQNMNYNGQGRTIESRDIAIAVILSIITCGIYGIYWMIQLNDDINYMVGDTQAPSGGIVFALSLVTCGIYSWYWMYKMGEKCDVIKRTNSSSAIVYLVLSIIGLGIVSYCLMQDTINKEVS